MTGITRKTWWRRVTTSTLSAAFAIVGGWTSAQELRPVAQDLTPKLLPLLRSEMLLIEDANRQIISYPISGDDAGVAEVAQQIHDNFILEQSMTPKDT
jgi:hypothetical protein